MGETTNANILANKCEWKGCKYGWENDIKIALKEMGLEGVDWIHLAQDGVQLRALVNIILL
jgi:hypothetical protein